MEVEWVCEFLRREGQPAIFTVHIDNAYLPEDTEEERTHYIEEAVHAHFLMHVRPRIKKITE